MACTEFEEWEDPKDPDSYIPYSFTWLEWLTEEGTALVDNIANREIIVVVTDEFVPAEDINSIVVDSIVVDVVNSKVFVWLSGGTAELKYNITCRITAANGIIEDKTAVLTMAEK